MIIKQDKKIVSVDTKNWPMIVDLFVKWGYPEELLDEAKENDAIQLVVTDLKKVTSELSDWDIVWKRKI